jgi:hypothetical protein
MPHLFRDDEPESTMPWPRQSRLELCPARDARVSFRNAGPAFLLSALVALAFAVDSRPATAQLLLLPEDSGPTSFPVSQLELRYAVPHPDQPALDPLLPIRVELRESEMGWVAPRPGDPTEKVEIGGPRSETVRLGASGLALTLRALVSAIHETGLYGVDVRPASDDIDLETERDLRPAGQDVLHVVVRVGRIGRVRTIAVGDRIKTDWKIDNELHEAIRDDSPLQPASTIDEEASDILDRHVLEDYLHRLNRHPGRRVEAALSPDEEPGSIVLDYRVAEAKPWFAYAQLSNTGTERTNEWQTRVGVVHRQLTNRDDIFSLEYLNGGKDVNGVRVKYDAPFFGPRRPDWMKRRTGDPAWIDWLPREKIPWWGIDRLRWNADFSYGKYEAGRSSIILIEEDAVVSEQIQGGGQLVYEAWQHRNFFVDVFAGLQLRDIRVENKTAPSAAQGDVLLVLPRGGFRAQQINAVSNFGAEFGAEGQVDSTKRDDRERLGRQNVDGYYAKLDFLFGYSTYLEPLLFPNSFRDPESRRSSTLAHELAFGFRGQYAFDYRLIPQASQIVGGLYSVRGYRQSEAVGDSVFVGSLEYRFHVPRALPIMREPLNVPLLGDFRVTPQQVYGRPDWDLTLRAFIDVGRAIRNANGVGDGTFEDDDTLLGVGIGAEFQFRSNLRARVDWATPLLSSAADGPGESLRFGEKSEVHLLFSILF